MDFIAKHLDYFKKKHGDIYEAYEEFGKKVHEQGGPLDEKTRSLIKLAVSSASQHHYAIKTHVRKARLAGCSWDEIEHAILLVAPTAGFPTMMEALICVREEMGEVLE